MHKMIQQAALSRRDFVEAYMNGSAQSISTVAIPFSYPCLTLPFVAQVRQTLIYRYMMRKGHEGCRKRNATKMVTMTLLVVFFGKDLFGCIRVYCYHGSSNVVLCLQLTMKMVVV